MRRMLTVVAGIGCAIGVPGCASSHGLDSVERVRHTPGTTDETIASGTFLNTYATSFRFRAGAPSGVTIVPGGEAVLFRQSAPGSRVQDLYEMDTRTGRVRVLLTAAQILDAVNTHVQRSYPPRGNVAA